MKVINSVEEYGVFYMPNEVPTAYPYNQTQSAKAQFFGALFCGVAFVAVILNLALLVYIIWHKLYQNFVSSQFIAHLCITNILGLCVLIPIFAVNLWTGENIWETNALMCRMQVHVYFKKSEPSNSNA